MGAPEPIASSALRVEMVLPSLAIGGMEVATRDLAVALLRRGLSVGITCLESRGELADETENAGVTVSLVKCAGFGSNFFANDQLVRHFRELKVDVVHTHNGVWGKAVCAARRAGAPAILNTLHGFAHNEPIFYHAMRWWAAVWTDRMIGVSSLLCNYLMHTLRVPNGRVCLIDNGIDTVRFAPGPRPGLRIEWGIPPDVEVIGCIARLDEVKNHRLLLQAMHEVVRVRPKTKLVLVGDGPLRSDLKKEAIRLSLGSHVSFLGSVMNTAPVYRELDVFVLPSLYEGTSISILESLASGVPTVATAVGGNPALLEHGSCGILTPSGDPKAMADALIEALDNQALRKGLIEKGLQRVRAFGTDAAAVQVEALYRKVLSSSGRLARSPATPVDYNR